jgi:hemerythrin superfamily protein
MKKASTMRARGRRPDAIALLKADHRQVETWFAQFENSMNQQQKEQLATNICDALTVHTIIEEEIFYPAFLETTGDRDRDIHHEAVVEHAGAKRLIEEIRGMASDDDYFDAKVNVLSEMIKHHVKAEEKAGGMFSEAKRSEMDMQALGQQLLSRKQELQSAREAA